MKYYLIAGEASGDLHASNLMKALYIEDKNADFRFWGGDLMQSVGGHLVKHYKELAFMGFVEVIKNLPAIIRNIKDCKDDIQKFQPDALILIDYSGFNLRIAKWAKSIGKNVFYYISPQVWASRSSRVATIKANVDQMFVILPFEKAFYDQYEMPVQYVGHPLLDVINHYIFQDDFIKKKQLQQPYIALLPGSRRQEIRLVLSTLLPLIQVFPNYQFVIAAAPAIPVSFYYEILKSIKISPEAINIVQGFTYDVLKHSKAAIVTSGTATLETALLNIPQIVVYKSNWLTYQIAKRIITIPYISLVNLIANRPLVTELIQNELTPQRLEKELRHLLDDEQAIVIRKGYDEIKSKLGKSGTSKRVAKLIVQYFKAIS